MWLLVHAALAGPGFLLPAGEPPGPWQEPLALAGLTLGCSGSPCVRVYVSGDRWLLVVDEQPRTATLPAPTTAAGRAEMAWLAASLTTPLVPITPRPTPPARPPAPPTARVPARPPVPKPPDPVTAAAPTAPPAPATAPGDGTPASPAAASVVAAADDDAAPAVAETPPGPAGPSGPSSPPEPAAAAAPGALPEPTAAIGAPSPVSPPDVEPDPPPVLPRLGGSLRASGGAATAPGLGPTVGGAFGAGFGGAAARLELSAAWTAGATMPEVTPTARAHRVDLLLTPLWTPRPWLAVGPLAGAAHRWWTDAGTTVGAAWTATAGAELRLVAPVGPAAGWLGVRGGADLRPVELVIDGASTGRLAPWWARAELGMSLDLRRAR